MGKRDKRHDSGRDSGLEAILTGRRQADATEIVALIHKVNPTGEALTAAVAAERYATKARLQSLLIRRWPNSLEVVPTADPGTVSLRHKLLGLDAAHAVVAALDDDARSWAQSQLDLAGAGDVEAGCDGRAGGEGPPATKARGRRGQASGSASTDSASARQSPAALIARGRAAMADYDFEVAKEALGQALALSGGGVDAAVALLELLVEQLGVDGEALALEDELSVEARAAALVRLLLAIAAARSGEDERALVLARGLEDARLASVYAPIAARALASGDTARARELVERGREHDAADHELIRLAGEIAARRAEEREREEARLTQGLARLPAADLVTAARDLLERWPESKLARQILRDDEARREQELLRAVVGDFEAALAAGRLNEAEALTQQSAWSRLAAGERERLNHALAAARETARASVRRAQVAELVTAIAAGRVAEGLTRWWELDDEGRRMARELEASHPALAWLEALSSSLSGAGSRSSSKSREAVDAALAAADAEARVELEPAAVLSLPVACARLLEPLGRFRDLRRRAEEISRQQRARFAAAALGRAEAALAAGHTEEAEQLIAQVATRDLAEEERARADTARAALRRAVERERLLASLERTRADDPLAARGIVEALLRSSDAAERVRWQSELCEAEARVRSALGVRVIATPMPILHVFEADASEYPPRWLDGAGTSVVLARSYGRWVILQRIDIESHRAAATVLLRAPESMELAEWQVEGPCVFLLGNGVLAIRMDDWRVESWLPPRALSAGGPPPEKVLLAGGRYLWAAYEVGRAGERTLVLDLQGDGTRDLPGVWNAELVHGAREPLLRADKRDGSSVLYSARGAALSHQPAPPRNWKVLALAPHPSGSGFVALLECEDDDTCEPVLDERVLAWCELPGDGMPSGELRPPRVQVIRDADAAKTAAIATALSSGLTFISCRNQNGEGQLLALAAAGPNELDGAEGEAGCTPVEGRLAQRYRIAAPAGMSLVQDAAGRFAAAFFADDAGCHVERLGSEPEPLRASASAADASLPKARLSLACHWPTDRRREEALQILANSKGDEKALARRAARLLKSEKSSAQELLPLYFALELSPYWDKLPPLYELMCRRHGDHPEVQLLRADDLARAARWEALRDLVARLEPESFDSGRRRHLHHLRGLAALMLGDDDGDMARRELEAGMTCTGECELEPLLQLAAPLPDGGTLSRVQRIRRAIERADAARVGGDEAAAVRALDTPEVWAAEEVQSLARLAASSLSLEAATEHDEVRRWLALTCYLDVHGRDEARRAELPIAANRWTREELDALAKRARAWLEQER